MAIDLGRNFQGIPGNRWPGMSPNDSEIFDRFVELHRGKFENLHFNIRVGEGEEPLADLSAAQKLSARMNSQKRIDAVVQFKGENIWHICEVRPRAAAGAAGNALVCAFLFSQEDERRVQPAIITDRISADMREFMQKNKIRLFETGLLR